MAKSIVVRPVGRLGNRMVQYLLAEIFRRKAGGDVPVYGPGIAEFGIAERKLSEAPPERPRAPRLKIDRHVFSCRRYLAVFRRTEHVQLRISDLSLRLCYYRRHLRLARSLFPQRPARRFDDRHLVIHIRLGDVLDGVHENYGPLPVDWYRRLIAATGKKPVFIGELGEDAYSAGLRSAFPEAEFLPAGGRGTDFATLRGSVNLVLSVSTFAFMAGWLSERARVVHMPVYGLFNPVDRPDVDVLPVGDRRFRFYRLPSLAFGGSAPEIEALVNQPAELDRIRFPRLFVLFAAFRASRFRRVAGGISLMRSLGEAVANFRPWPRVRARRKR